MSVRTEAKWADELAGEKVLRESAVRALADLRNEFEEWKNRPCGSCHPCMNWADETWRRADRKPPTVFSYDELRAEVERLQTIEKAAHRLKRRWYDDPTSTVDDEVFALFALVAAPSPVLQAEET